MLLDSLDKEEDFDVLGPVSWPVESCSPMGVRVSSSTQATLLVLRRTRCIVINAFLGMMRIASIYGMCIQWHPYEAAWIWRLKVPMGIGRNLFCLTFLLWAYAWWTPSDFIFYIRHPERTIFHICYPWNFIEVPSFFTFLEQKMSPESWVLQLRQRKRRLKILLFFNRTRKSTLLLRPGTVASADRARFLIILQTSIKNVQELAEEEGEESEVKLRGAIEISEGAVSSIAGSWQDPWRATS